MTTIRGNLRKLRAEIIQYPPNRRGRHTEKDKNSAKPKYKCPDVQITVKPNQLVIQSARRPRQDWDEQFRMMAERGDDRLLDEAVLTRWDEDEWEW